MNKEKSATPAMDALQKLMAGEGVVNLACDREATLIEEQDIPFVTMPTGEKIQLQMVDLNQNLWIVRTKFPPGYVIDTHYHTGQVFAVTRSGEWFYKEYPEKINKSGSFLYEPAHSLHTLTVSPDATEEADVWFAIFGSNINVDEKGNVVSILDARATLVGFRALCEVQGLDCSNINVLGE